MVRIGLWVNRREDEVIVCRYRTVPFNQTFHPFLNKLRGVSMWVCIICTSRCGWGYRVV